MENNKINKLKKKVIELALWRLKRSEVSKACLKHNGIEICLGVDILIKKLQKRKIDAKNYFTIKNEKIIVTFYTFSTTIESSTPIELRAGDIITVPGSVLELLEEAIEAFSKNEVIK